MMTQQQLEAGLTTHFEKWDSMEWLLSERYQVDAHSRVDYTLPCHHGKVPLHLCGRDMSRNTHLMSHVTHFKHAHSWCHDDNLLPGELEVTVLIALLVNCTGTHEGVH